MDKSVENFEDLQIESSHILEATSALAENLMQSESFLKLKEAEQIFNNNKEVSTLITNFENLRQKIIAGQNNGNYSESDITQFRSLQMEIVGNEIIQDYNLAQESAKDLLKDVNQEISQILGINFATLAQRAGGC